MAPHKQQPPQPPFQKDERVLCFHMEMLYEAKILDTMPAEGGDGWQYKIHYKGWKSSWDDWVPQDRVRKFTDENKDLAAQLLAQFKSLQSGKTAKQSAKKPVASSSRAPNGSDMSSARGSEERTAGVAAATTGRGPRRARDYELEQVSLFFLCFVDEFLPVFLLSFFLFFSFFLVFPFLLQLLALFCLDVIQRRVYCVQPGSIVQFSAHCWVQVHLLSLPEWACIAGQEGIPSGVYHQAFDRPTDLNGHRTSWTNSMQRPSSFLQQSLAAARLSTPGRQLSPPDLYSWTP